MAECLILSMRILILETGLDRQNHNTLHDYGVSYVSFRAHFSL